MPCSDKQMIGQTVQIGQCVAVDGREFVERALKKAPMPYSGFETVFMRQVELGFCYPREDCER